MNKWQIICPAGAVVLLLLLTAPAYVKRIRMHRQDVIIENAIWVARDLESKTNSDLLDRIPPRVQQELSSFLTTPTAYVETLRFGDEPPPLGDGTATHRVYIRNLDDKFIALRLRYDSNLRKFHLLGFWHPDSWPE
jgi:hypothetical protein